MVGINTIIETLIPDTTKGNNVVALVANTAKDILPQRAQSGRKFVYRYLQNLTGAELYIAIDNDCDNQTNFHFVIADRQVFSVPSNGRVSGFSVGGGNVVTCELERKDNIGQSFVGSPYQTGISAEDAGH